MLLCVLLSVGRREFAFGIELATEVSLWISVNFSASRFVLPSGQERRHG